MVDRKYESGSGVGEGVYGRLPECRCSRLAGINREAPQPSFDATGCVGFENQRLDLDCRDSEADCYKRHDEAVRSADLEAEGEEWLGRA